MTVKQSKKHITAWNRTIRQTAQHNKRGLQKGKQNTEWGRCFAANGTLQALKVSKTCTKCSINAHFICLKTNCKHQKRLHNAAII